MDVRESDNAAPTPADEIERFLRTGDSDPLFLAWSGNTLVRCQTGDDALRDALSAEVRRRTAGRPPADAPAGMDVDLLVRQKLDRMVRGLFPISDREAVLHALLRGVCILTSERIESVLRACPWPDTAWTVANIYLREMGAPTLRDDFPPVVGLSVETVSYVSVGYFSDDDPFADFVVHEAAHAFHNSKRETIGLPPRERQPWLLDIAYGKRETFAYACEAYSRILDLGTTARARRELVGRLAQQPPPADERVDATEFIEIVDEACSARNGWTRILERCAPTRPLRRSSRTSPAEH